MAHGNACNRVSPTLIQPRQRRTAEQRSHVSYRPAATKRRDDSPSGLAGCGITPPSAPTSPFLYEALACIHSAPIFSKIPEPEAAQLASTARIQTFARQQALFREDEPLASISIIASGRVKITQLSRSGKEVILRVDCAGDVLDGLEPATAVHDVSARALEPCRVFSWNSHTFASISQQSPTIHRNAAKILAERLRSLEERFRDMATERVPQRLARMLIRFLEQNTPPLPMVGIGLSYEELAQMVGTTQFTVSRVLCQWAAQGIIEPDRKAILIENLEALMEVAAAES
jgi:CRP-like cAMP-binding protein